MRVIEGENCERETCTSSPAGRKHKPRDPRGDSHGIIEPAPAGGNLDRDCIISARWCAHRLRNAAAADSFDREDDEFVDNLDDVAKRMAWAAAAWRVFKPLWRATDRRVRAGLVIDGAELLLTGRYGTVDQIVADLLAGRYADAPRDGEGYLVLGDEGE
jgi:hypothetical protein